MELGETTIELGYDDIPWPTKAEPAVADDVCSMLLCGVDPSKTKQALREEVKRWYVRCVLQSPRV